MDTLTMTESARLYRFLAVPFPGHTTEQLAREKSTGPFTGSPEGDVLLPGRRNAVFLFSLAPQEQHQSLI